MTGYDSIASFKKGFKNPVPLIVNLTALRAFIFPTVLTLGFVSISLLDPIQQNIRLLLSFLGTGVVLLVWCALLFLFARIRNRTFKLKIVLRSQHYLQSLAQGTVLLYWGWYWGDVYDSAYLIASQVVFAYVFDMLLSWGRRDAYTLGFGPVPVILSINLFLWFRPDWFYLQFLLVAVGFSAKELIRWNKDGQSVHIFNPSSFALAVFSIGLLLTGMSDITRGQEIAVTQFYPPHMYVVLFLVSLPGQLLFGVATMTMSAVVSAYLFGIIFFLVTGTYFFFDSYIPIAIFLGMHLLFTDPSTAPKTELGRIFFGILYGLSSVILYDLLSRAGLPAFYDKLLQVPVLNLSINLIDRIARSKQLNVFNPERIGRLMTKHQRNFAYVSIWGLVFLSLSITQGVGDRHPGQWLPFWQQACSSQMEHIETGSSDNEGVRPSACGYLTQLQSMFCYRGSGWACNELGVLQISRESNPIEATFAFEDGCELGFEVACQNLPKVKDGMAELERSAPLLDDYPIILRGSKGPIEYQNSLELYNLACKQGWPDTCE